MKDGEIRSLTFGPFGLECIPYGGGLAYLRRIQCAFSCVKGIRGIVMEVGCQEGKHCSQLMREGGEYYIGCDINRASLISAKTENSTMKADFICCDATKLPFSSSVFDFVLCLETLEHIEDEEIAISEICRTMKRGASCVFSVPSINLWSYFKFFLALKLGRLADRPYKDPSHYREYGKYLFHNKITPIKHLIELIQDNGLEIVSQKSAWVLGLLPPGKYFNSVLHEPHEHVRMVKILLFVDVLMSKLTKSLGLYTIIATRKL